MEGEQPVILLAGGRNALRRWAPLAGAVLLTVVLAGGVAAAADQLVAPAAQPEPHLKTVPTATLTRLGLSLAPSTRPPYCAVTDQGVERGWLHPGTMGCPISRAAAESLARRGGRSRVIESLLARVTSQSLAGRDQLTWLVVTQFSGANVGPGGMWTGGTRVAFYQLVLVNAHTGILTGMLSLSPAMPARGRRSFPTSVGLVSPAG